MVLAGSMTVLTSFVFIGFLLSIFGKYPNFASETILGKLFSIVLNTTEFTLVGSIFTLGVPYLIGAMLSVVFADAKTPSTK